MRECFKAPNFRCNAACANVQKFNKKLPQVCHHQLSAAVDLVKTVSVQQKTRKLCYRKDDRAMRPIHGALKIFGTP